MAGRCVAELLLALRCRWLWGILSAELCNTHNFSISSKVAKWASTRREEVQADGADAREAVAAAVEVSAQATNPKLGLADGEQWGYALHGGHHG